MRKPPAHLGRVVELELELRDVRASPAALETGPEAMGARNGATDDRQVDNEPIALT